MDVGRGQGRGVEEGAGAGKEGEANSKCLIIKLSFTISFLTAKGLYSYIQKIYINCSEYKHFQ